LRGCGHDCTSLLPRPLLLCETRVGVRLAADAREVREFPKGRLELLKVGGVDIGRAIFEPGWRWSTSVQPLVKTKSCEAPHFQYHVSGVLKILMDDGTELECKPGDVSLLPSGMTLGW
jgi:hypothetical protein